MSDSAPDFPPAREGRVAKLGAAATSDAGWGAVRPHRTGLTAASPPTPALLRLSLGAKAKRAALPTRGRESAGGCCRPLHQLRWAPPPRGGEGARRRRMSRLQLGVI